VGGAHNLVEINYRQLIGRVPSNLLPSGNLTGPRFVLLSGIRRLGVGEYNPTHP